MARIIDLITGTIAGGLIAQLPAVVRPFIESKLKRAESREAKQEENSGAARVAEITGKYKVAEAEIGVTEQLLKRIDALEKRIDETMLRLSEAEVRAEIAEERARQAEKRAESLSSELHQLRTELFSGHSLRD